MAVAIISNNTTGTYTGTYTGTTDTELTEGSPTTNYVTGTQYYISYYGTGEQRRPVIVFGGLSNIPANSTVTDAVMGIYCTGNIGGADFTASARRLLRNWTGNQATWNSYVTGSAWTTAGAGSDGNDRAAGISASTTIGTIANVWYTWTAAQLITDVQDMVTNGSNYGWLLSYDGAAGADRYRYFGSSEYTDGRRPYLSVTYSATAGTPLPVLMNLQRQFRN
jgi:hypothetical protein